MKKIKFKISVGQLDGITFVLGNADFDKTMDINYNAVLSIGIEVYKKLKKKTIDKMGESESANFQIILKYHEAFALQKMLRNLSAQTGFLYENNASLMVANLIGKML